MLRGGETVAILVLLSTTVPLAAQQVQLGARAAIGQGAGWTSSGMDATTSAGLRVQLNWSRWGSYALVSRRVVPVVCLITDTHCSDDDAIETSVGVSRLGGTAEGIRGQFSLGVGILRWMETEPFGEAEAAVRFPLFGAVGIDVGVRGMATPRALGKDIRDPWNVDLTAGISVVLN